MRVPTSTYRLQLHAGFPLEKARALLPYLHELGVGDVYLSPVLRSRRGSPHGYDTVDPREIDPELGGEPAFRAFAEEARRREMGVVLDLVPNHMAACAENQWWQDVLAHGPRSPHARVFDLDWAPASAFGTVAAQLLLPVLGAPYARVLAAGELRLDVEDGVFLLRHHDRAFPLRPASWETLLAPLAADEPERGEELRALVAAAAAVERAEGEALASLARELHARLAALLVEREGLLAALRRSLARLDGDPEALHELLEAQHWRLADWHLASEVASYRRFFDITELVGVRVEDPAVFEATHVLVLRLASEGLVTGLRIDHVDGLADPEAYLRRLHERAPGAEPWVVVEKILAAGETLPAGWEAAGTTGYELQPALNAAMVDPEGLARLEEVYAEFTGGRRGFGEELHRAKRQIAERLFAGELQERGIELHRLAALDRHSRDLPRRALASALVEVAACFPVYRTYVRAGRVSAADRRHVASAVAEARRREPRPGDEVYEFVRRTLLLEPDPPRSEQVRGAQLAFVRRWQQLTGPITAKGMEDTALYRHSALLSLNEVGVEHDPVPERLGLAAFHALCRQRAERTPHGLSATSTHDSKRGEDVRARLHVLSELPEVWAAALRRWSRQNAPLRGHVEGRPVPDRVEEAFLYQTLLGAWPLEEREVAAWPERLAAYLVKAAREAKRHSSWREPRPEHEEALLDFLRTILDPERAPDFLRDFHRLRLRVARLGVLGSLAQVVLKATVPGVPDVYRGSELWNLDLVDPDNRRPVDFERRRRLLRELAEAAGRDRRALCARLLRRWWDPRVKLYVTWQALRLSAERADLFRDGAHVPLEVTGPASESVCAFARHREGEWAATVAGVRLASLSRSGAPPLGASWSGTALTLPAGAPDRWRERLSGETLAAARGELALERVFAHLSVALLEPA